MARPRKNPAAPATPVRVLEAARAAFATHGFAQAKLADIARVVGIRRPSLLYHFPTKADLYRAVVAEAFSEMGGALLPTLALDGTVPERLEALVRSYVGYVEANPGVAQIIVHELVVEAGPGQSILLEQVAPLIDNIVAFVRVSAVLAPGVDPRAAVLHIASDALLRSASGAIRDPLWGTHASADTAWAVARALLWSDR